MPTTGVLVAALIVCVVVSGFAGTLAWVLFRRWSKEQGV